MDSEWNAAVQFFVEIGKCYSLINESTLRNDNKTLFQTLYTLHKHILGQMKPDERTKAMELHRKAEIVVHDGRYNPGLEKVRLYEYEQYLRDILRIRKLDIPRSKDPAKAILGG